MSVFATAHTLALGGLVGVTVCVEAHVGPGLVQTRIVGNPDSSVREAADRVRAAFMSCNLPALNKRLTVNLSPADLPKSGASFDLAIAVAILKARGLLDDSIGLDTALGAEVALDGSLQPIRGALAVAWAAKEQGFKRLIVAPECAEEAAQVQGIQVFGCGHLKELLDAFSPGEQPRWDTLKETFPSAPRPYHMDIDLAEVRGQEDARRAALVAAVGGHNMLLHGEPGAGKSLLAARLSTLLPDMDAEQAMTCAALRSLTGIAAVPNLRPPSESVSPSTTLAAMVGGGSREVRPGAISLAHGGVLVLDEAPEFPRKLLEALRSPLDEGVVTTRRALHTVTFPAKFQLIMTANPCPCGGKQCSCRANAIRLYRQKLSGPVLDRVDIFQRMVQPTEAALQADVGLSSTAGRNLVLQAQERSKHRWPHHQRNNEAGGHELRDGMDQGFLDTLRRGLERGWMSMRGVDRVLRLSWSIADLEGHGVPSAEDFAYALDLRTKDAWNV